MLRDALLRNAPQHAGAGVPLFDIVNRKKARGIALRAMPPSRRVLMVLPHRIELWTLQNQLFSRQIDQNYIVN
jgi:hypothetical protein